MKRLALCLLAATACTDVADLYDGEQIKSDDGKADASALATFVDAEFTGTVVVDSSWDTTQTIQAAQYTRPHPPRPRKQGKKR